MARSSEERGQKFPSVIERQVRKRLKLEKDRVINSERKEESVFEKFKSGERKLNESPKAS